ncbi:piggyBac transposable element-derived protein 4-like [Melitaea cinxia]|uniref:piggyBac transposable element-derived protein 4-like n=1 Tax=Melitaea cinxia TaxID=113334 RepID=UPI001E274B94|nr:piggyBac transposable element-derived protein 4-like [Melitaea cinxia]
MDNWFNSPLLTRFLKKNKTDVVGSLRPNRQHLPPLITQCKLQAGQFVARHSGDMTVMAYHDKKKVSLISTYHGTQIAQGPEKAFRSAQWKPQLVLDYNKNMGGVDLKDGMLEAYLIERKRCSKWTMKLFKHLLNVSILNARICFTASTGKKVEHIVFRLELVEQILKDNLSKVPFPRQSRPGTHPGLSGAPVTEWHFPSTVTKRRADGRTSRRRCIVCSKQVTFECKLCDVGLCIDQCFRKSHLDRF